MGKNTIKRVMSQKKNVELTAKVASNTNYLHESQKRIADVLAAVCEYLEQPWWRRLSRKSLVKFFEKRNAAAVEAEKQKNDAQNFTVGTPAVIPEPQEPPEGQTHTGVTP